MLREENCYVESYPVMKLRWPKPEEQPAAN
jgi:hypothetical protein